MSVKIHNSDALQCLINALVGEISKAKKLDIK